MSDWSSDVCSSDLQALGAALAERLVDLGWIARKRNSRAVSVTEAGRRKLAEEFRLDL